MADQCSDFHREKNNTRYIICLQRFVLYFIHALWSNIISLYHSLSLCGSVANKIDIVSPPKIISYVIHLIETFQAIT